MQSSSFRQNGFNQELYHSQLPACRFSAPLA